MVSGNAAGLKTKGGMVDFENDLGSLKVGLLDESGTVYGTPTGTGALRFGNGTQTTFIEAGSGFDTGSWAINGYASLAATRLKIGDDTLLVDASMQWGGRMGFTASRSLLNGRMSLGVAQPLTILKGNGTYTVGSGYDLAARSLMFSDRTVDMAGRFMPRMTVGYEQMGTRSSLRMGAGANADGSDLRAVGSWTNRF